MASIIATIRDRIPGNVLDYGLLMDCLGGYASPRAKLTQLLRTEQLVRVRKGLYVLGDDYRREPLSMEIIANMVYGPSYVSLEWALQFYGMIPEFVVEVTSVTAKRNKRYDTPIGRFSYSHCHPAAYPVGITLSENEHNLMALIATKEKALCDLLVIRRGKLGSDSELEAVLFDDFRLEESDLSTLKMSLLTHIQDVHAHSSIGRLIKLLKRIQQ